MYIILLTSPFVCIKYIVLIEKEQKKILTVTINMENSALNKAHQQHRLADKHLRYHRYSEAICCHLNAVELLSDALMCTENPRSLESIKLQIDFHKRQKNIINLKKEQHEQYKMAFENKFCTFSESGCDDNEGNLIMDAIYQTMEETDSLIELIQHQTHQSELQSLQVDTAHTEKIKENNQMQTSASVVRHPKDDKTVIEEFKILNKQLYLLISKLVNQLESSKKENQALKQRLNQFEYEKAQNNQNQFNHLKIVADSSGGTSPYVFSPCSDLSSEVQEQNELLSIQNSNSTTQDFEN